MEQVTVRDLKICCESVGDGYPIVLIMGLTANMDWWDPELVEALSRKYRVLMFDNRGAGRTVTPLKASSPPKCSPTIRPH